MGVGLALSGLFLERDAKTLLRIGVAYADLPCMPPWQTAVFRLGTF